MRNFEELVTRCSSYTDKRSVTTAPTVNPTIGCIVLEHPIFLDDADFVSPEEHAVMFPNQVVKIKYFDHVGLFPEQSSLSVDTTFELVSQDKAYKQVKVKERRGQSQFRQKILEAYGYKCAITGETCGEVLQAAHIQPYITEDSNHIQNGICLRTDLHMLFDAGLITIDSEYRVIVRPRLESSTYTALHGTRISLPSRAGYRPSLKSLRFHQKNVFRS